MFKVFKISIPIILLSLIGLFLYRNPGRVEIYWLDYELYTSIAVLLISLVVLYMLVSFIIALYVNVKKLPKVVRDLYLKLRGVTPRDSIQNTFYDMATGNSKRLFSDAEKIADNIGKTYVSDYLKAKAALFSSNTDKAKIHYKNLLSYEKGKFLGYRGLAKIAIRENDLDIALEYTHQAALIEPSAPWVLRSLLRLFIETGSIKQAQTLLDKLKSEKAMKNNELQSYQIDLWKKAISMENEIPKKLSLFEKVFKEKPIDKENNLGYIDLLLEVKNYSKAISLIKNIWETNPNSILVKRYIDNITVKNSDNNKKLLNSVIDLCEKLYKDKPNNEQSIIALTEAYMARKEFDKAYKTLEPAIKTNKAKSSVAYQLMATLEINIGGNLKAAESFLEKSLKITQD